MGAGSYTPIAGYYFRVDFLPPEMKGYAFREVSGIEAKIDIQTLAEGGVNTYEHKLVGRTTYENLILKRGLNPVEFTDPLYYWLSGTFTLNSLLMLPVVAQPFVIITLLDDSGMPAASWNFMNVYPVRWDVGDFNSEEDGIIIEEIEFAYNTFQRLPVSGASALIGGLMSIGKSALNLASSAISTIDDALGLDLFELPPEGLQASAEEVNPVSFPGLGDGAALVTATGGSPPYSYLWDNGEDDPDATRLEGGNHQVKVTDSVGDSAVAVVTIKEPVELRARIEVLSHVSKIGGEDGIAKVIASGASGEYEYLWDNEETEETTRTLNAGVHLVKVSDADGQNIEARVVINEPKPLTAKVVLRKQVSDGTKSDGVAAVIPSGGVKPYSFLWDNGETLSIAEELNAGFHKVMITDGNEDQVEGEVEVTIPVLKATVKEISPVSQFGKADGGALVTASGGTPDAENAYEYKWDNNETTAEAKELTGGLHKVTVTDSAGQTVEVSVTIKEPEALSAKAVEVSAVTIFGKDDGVAEVTAKGGIEPYSYKWDNEEATAKVSNLKAGEHTVVVTDDGGNEIEVSVVINQPKELMLEAMEVSGATSNTEEDGKAKVIVTGGTKPYTYEWDSGETEEEALKLGPGEHTVTVKDAVGAEKATTVIISKPELTAVITEQTDVTNRGGEDGSATVEASGGTEEYTYEWDNGETEATATKLIAGRRKVKVKDSDGAEVEVSVTIKQPDALRARAVEKSPVSIDKDADGQAEVVATGGSEPYKYRWDNGETEAVATTLDPGTHEVTVTDNAGAVVTAKVKINKLIKLSAEAVEEQPVSETGGSDGIAKVTVKGGMEPYSYQWDSNAGDQATERAIGLQAGTYKVKVTDAEGTEVEVEVTITEP